MFTKRPKDTSIFFTRNYKPAEIKIENKINNGDAVVLKINEESVLVKNVIDIGNGEFKGTIYGFEPSYNSEYDDLKIDQDVEFSHDYIFACGDKV